ncbi:MAG: hypothetical protein IJY42_06745, partial [Clostridia bacterium]|nr:hypothetical protein [Clostridia bacterium]
MKKSVFSSPVSEASLPGRTERVLLCGVCVGLAVLSALLLFGSVGSDGMLMLSLLSCGLSLITVIRAARSLQAAIGLLLVMASGLLLAGLYTLTGIAVSLAAVTAVTAMLWTAKPNPWFLLLPLLSGGIAFVLLRSPYAVVFAILPFALAILLGEHLRRRGSRASGVCRMALVLLLLTVL